MSAHFGEHLTIDGYGGDIRLLNEKSLLERILTDLPQSLGMHNLINPQVVFAPGNGEKDPGGWSGFVIIAESHISIHTFPQRGFVSVDVYSCQNGMDVDAVKNYIQKAFLLKDMETNFIIRGTRYPETNIGHIEPLVQEA
jgi:S-adenosylmethionine decarboxylase